MRARAEGVGVISGPQVANVVKRCSVVLKSKIDGCFDPWENKAPFPGYDARLGACALYCARDGRPEHQSPRFETLPS